MKIQINEIKRMQLLAGIITEVLDQDLVDTLAKEVEEKFGKNYFLTNHLVNTAKFREFNQWEDEKIKQYGYKAKLALTQISVN
jgi:hypothetical protein